ncbi:AraC family transcriptional regulator [Shewanella sp. VB17]|nr:AraC family transcriptional regulator [Shewanella sp. VB17]
MQCTTQHLLKVLNYYRHGLPLVETALATGFCDQAHFNRMFKSTYGITPGRYTDIVSAN